MPFAAPSRGLARAVRALSGLAAAAVVCTLDGPLVAGDPDVQTPENPSQTPAVTYAGLDASACQSELTRRGVSFQSVDTARGVLAPLRLTGPIRGVTFRSTLPEKARATAAWEIVDCRLALALDDFAAILAERDVKEVVHFSMYRPPPLRGWIDGMLGKRHTGALAIDAARFVKSDGTTLDVETHFGGRIGQKTCGTSAAPQPKSTEGRVLREIVCEAADKHLFNVQLTPHYNRAHKNHLHLEVTPGVKWFLIR
ncbi:MAG: extensin family protein [Myxococcales bacterium]|nr:extensin family protein [Myxococcales bacterium]